jgi:hypothetical protein
MEPDTWFYLCVEPESRQFQFGTAMGGSAESQELPNTGS